MRKTFGMNPRQKRAHKRGEAHVSKAQVEELLVQSCSEDPAERAEAARYLCPCHVRTRIPAVWDALYRMLEDPDPRVRWAAWHTLEDGGRPEDPALQTIIERAQQRETDARVQSMIRRVVGQRQDRELALMRLAGRPLPKQRGKCDFCGERDVFVERDLETMIPDDGFPRAAWICQRCDKS